MLHYQLAVGTGPAAFVEGEEWTNDFQQVTQNESWFMHNDREHRLHQEKWDWYLMDIRFAGGRPRTGFPAYWVRSALRRMRANENDGCFADSYTQDILLHQLDPSFRLFTDAETNKRSWLPHLNAYGAWCAAAFHRQPERFYYLPNLGGLVTTWDTVTDLAVGDGGMNEGFAAPEPGKHYSDDDWKLQMSRVLGLAARRKIVICQTSVDPDRHDHRWFVVGSYLLTIVSEHVREEQPGVVSRIPPRSRRLPDGAAARRGRLLEAGLEAVPAGLRAGNRAGQPHRLSRHRAGAGPDLSSGHGARWRRGRQRRPGAGIARHPAGYRGDRPRAQRARVAERSDE